MEWVNLVQVSPGAEPISSADLKAFLNYEDTDQDSLISALGVAARSYAETRTRRALITQTWQGHFSSSPCSEIWLPRPRIISVESVKYYDTADSLQTLATDSYHVVAGENGRIKVTTWPSVHATRPDRYQINWTSGYGAAGSDVPEDIITAMKMLVAFLFEERTGDTRGATFAGKDVDVPAPIKFMLEPYKVPIAR